MLLYHLDDIGNCTLAFLSFILVCVAYTYVVNIRRQSDDPKKREYHPLAIILAPCTFLLFLSLGIFVFFLRALLFAGFLVVFTVLLVGLRKPFLFIWWDTFATKIGDPLLKINTELIKMAFNAGVRKPQVI
ncbi:MAG: hypothetical protein ABI621_09695 [Chloroflexota bacterium]